VPSSPNLAGSGFCNGRGLFDDELSRRGVTVESTVLRACTERLPDWAADALQLNHGSQGVTLERLRESTASWWSMS